jgi:hypothetical protein
MRLRRNNIQGHVQIPNLSTAHAGNGCSIHLFAVSRLQDFLTGGCVLVIAMAFIPFEFFEVLGRHQNVCGTSKINPSFWSTLILFPNVCHCPGVVFVLESESYRPRAKWVR